MLVLLPGIGKTVPPISVDQPNWLRECIESTFKRALPEIQASRAGESRANGVSYQAQNQVGRFEYDCEMSGRILKFVRDSYFFFRLTSNQKAIVIALLAKLNTRRKDWQDVTVKPGECIISIDSLARDSGSDCTPRQVRTVIKLLESSDYITRTRLPGRLGQKITWMSGPIHKETEVV